MNFQEAIQVCFQKYFDFNGRAKRPEFWWFFLFCFLVALILGMISNSISMLFSLATLISLHLQLVRVACMTPIRVAGFSLYGSSH
jgi:uncharacterized membrane protein YhaH (DUF805 family)